jgi:hypothetical protein
VKTCPEARPTRTDSHTDADRRICLPSRKINIYYFCVFVLLDSILFSHMFLHEIPTVLHFTHKRSMGDRANRQIVGL